MIFAKLVDRILPEFMLRVTNVKDLCVELEKDSKLRKTWGGGTKKPDDETRLELVGCEVASIGTATSQSLASWNSPRRAR